jgi:hypothetical protein
MNQVNPMMRDFAERLVVYEAKENKSSDPHTPAALLVCEKLRSNLVILMGNAGFQMLLSRALALASTEVPWLCAARVNANGSLEGWDELETQIDAKEIAEDSIVLVAQLLELLTAFIGEKLTVQIVCEVWPKLSLADLSFVPGDKK